MADRRGKDIRHDKKRWLLYAQREEERVEYMQIEQDRRAELQKSRAAAIEKLKADAANGMPKPADTVITQSAIEKKARDLAIGELDDDCTECDDEDCTCESKKKESKEESDDQKN